MSSNANTQRAVLVTGATGQQGGAVVDALLATGGFTVLAVTRDVSSPKADELKAKGAVPVQGDLDDSVALLKAAATAAGGPVWGVFSVQAAAFGTDINNLDASPEVKQGKGLIDAAVAARVQFFVYATVDRGGNEASWDNATDVSVFATKHLIEHYLRDNAKSMGWTILRPMSFMENLTAGSKSAAYLGLCRSILGNKCKMYWVSTGDIGRIAALAFQHPTQWNHKAFGIAGDFLTLDEVDAIVERVIGSKPAYSTEGGQYLAQTIPDMVGVVSFPAGDQYYVDIEQVRKAYPKILDLETWAKQSMQE